MSSYISLNKMKPGESATIHSLRSTGSMRRRLLDIGLTKNTEIQCIGRSPNGSPSAYLIRGAVIALRHADCADVLVYPKES